MANTATVTAKIGPGNTITAGVFTNVTVVDYKLATNILTLVQSGGKITDMDMSAVTTVTMVLASGVWTVTVS